MKLLEIRDSHDAYYKKEGSWVPISAIEKGDILPLVKAVATLESVEMDECARTKNIANQIDKTIYVNLYELLNDLRNKKDVYLDEISRQFDELEIKMGLRE